MKVIIYCSKFPPLAGGAGKSAHYMGQHLSHNGHQVHVVCEHAPGLKGYEMIGNNYHVHRVQVPFLKNRSSGVYFLLLCLAIAAKGMKMSFNIKPDIFHFFDTATGIAGLITKFFIKKPSIYYFGGSITYEYMCNMDSNNGWDPVLGENHIWKNATGILKIIFNIEKKFFLNNDRVYTVAKYLSDMLDEHFRMKFPRVRYIPNGIDTELLKPENFKNIKPDLGYSNLIYVGVRFVKYKALDILIQACLPILDEIDAHLVIGGSGPEEQTLKQLANGHPRIKFLGNLTWEENIQYVRSADVFVLPTLVDKTPNCVMEALSLKVPCITSDIDGVKELIPPQGGILIKPNDPELLRQKIKWIFENPTEAKFMGSRARDFMVANFDWKTICSNVKSIYDELLDHQAVAS